MLSVSARAAIEENPLLISPMVMLELDFLRKIGRLKVAGQAIVEHLRARIGLEICGLAFPKVIVSASGITWTRDPFDRVIVGQAAAAARSLLTKDRSIRRRYRASIW